MGKEEKDPLEPLVKYGLNAPTADQIKRGDEQPPWTGAVVFLLVIAVTAFVFITNYFDKKRDPTPIRPTQIEQTAERPAAEQTFEEKVAAADARRGTMVQNIAAKEIPKIQKSLKSGEAERINLPPNGYSDFMALHGMRDLADVQKVVVEYLQSGNDAYPWALNLRLTNQAQYGECRIPEKIILSTLDGKKNWVNKINPSQDSLSTNGCMDVRILNVPPLTAARENCYTGGLVLRVTVEFYSSDSLARPEEKMDQGLLTLCNETTERHGFEKLPKAKAGTAKPDRAAADLEKILDLRREARKHQPSTRLPSIPPLPRTYTVYKPRTFC
jgi:hypothetical protein